MAPTTREQYEDTFLHCMSLIDKIEYHDGSGEICQMLVLNEIDTILDIISLDDEELKTVYKATPSSKPKTHLSMS